MASSTCEAGIHVMVPLKESSAHWTQEYGAKSDQCLTVSISGSSAPSTSRALPICRQTPPSTPQMCRTNGCMMIETNPQIQPTHDSISSDMNNCHFRSSVFEKSSNWLKLDGFDPQDNDAGMNKKYIIGTFTVLGPDGYQYLRLQHPGKPTSLGRSSQQSRMQTISIPVNKYT
jgi:hypothetical protein